MSSTPTIGSSPIPPLRQRILRVPLVSTIHATEAGRHSGWINGAISRQVHALEYWLVRESDSLITCSASMRDEVIELFGPGLDEAHVIRNGIDARRWPFARRISRGAQRACFTSGGWSTKRASTTSSPRCRESGAPSGYHVDDRRRWHAAGLAPRGGPSASGAAGDDIRRSARPQRAAACTAWGRCGRTPKPRRTVRDRRAGGRRGRDAAGDVDVGRWEAVIEGGPQSRCPPRHSGLTACAVLDDPEAAQQRAIAARERLTSDFDWGTVARETAQVYLAAKRREREPLARPVIVERALPDR